MPEIAGVMRAALQTIAGRYRIADVYAFGSRALEVAARIRRDPAEAARSGSDIDLAVQPLPDQYLDAQERVQLAAELEDLLEAGRVDLVVLSEASPYLALDVIRGELLFTADPHAQAEHELYVMRRAADLAPHERERRRLIAETFGAS